VEERRGEGAAEAGPRPDQAQQTQNSSPASGEAQHFFKNSREEAEGQGIIEAIPFERFVNNPIARRLIGRAIDNPVVKRLAGRFAKLLPSRAPRAIPKPSAEVIRGIKALPDGAKLTANQAAELGKNLDAILQKTLPAKVRSGRVQDVVDLLKTDSRFRFLDQVPGGHQRIVDAFEKLGQEFK
jgi:hypothetical protein